MINLEFCNMFKKLKSLFIVETDDSDDKEKKVNQEEMPAEAEDSSVDQPTSETLSEENTPAPSGKPQTKFVDFLLKALEKNNQEGLDYLEFKNSLKSLVDVLDSEDQMYKSAFAMGSSMGLTKEKLLSSIQFYLEILKQEKEKFDTKYQHKSKEIVSESKTQYLALQSGLKTKQEQLEILKKEIAAAEHKMDKLKTDVQQSRSRLDQTKASFDASYEALANQIKEDYQDIQKYI